jgi:hypothetical protein
MILEVISAKKLLRGAVAGTAFLMLGACASVDTNGLDQAELSKETLFQQKLALEDAVSSRQKIEQVSFRLMTAAADFCAAHRTAAYGFTVANRYSLGPEMEQAASGLGLDDSARVLTVVKGSPAALAGLKKGDLIARVNGKAIAPGAASVESVSAEMAKAGLDGLDLSVGGAHSRRVRVEAVMACDFPTELVDSDKVNAYADGERIRITKGMMWFAEDNTDLAMVMAHELAHNIMGHVGTFSGLFQDKKSREADADYVGLYIMARAGFQIEKAPGFWRRMAAAFPSMIESTSSHPLMPERFVAIRNTTKEIRLREANGLPLIPHQIEDLALLPPSQVAGPHS